MPHPTLLFNSILLNNSVFQKHLGLTLDMKNMKNTHGGVLLLACNFTKSNTPPWVFFTFLNCINGTKSRTASYICNFATLYFNLFESTELDKPNRFLKLRLLFISVVHLNYSQPVKNI